MAEFPKIFVTGYPIRHSRSPQIHRYWLKLYQLEGSYDPIETTEETFPVFIRSLRKQGFCGGNITLPYKERAYFLAEECDKVAMDIGAVNTLWFEKGVLHGSNTDAYGFACNLDDFMSDWERNTALVIGAGGASRAVLFALKERGYKQIILVNRTRIRADRLANHFGKTVIAADWRYINDYINRAELIVNTASLGMENHSHDKNDSLTIDFTRANPNVVVTDIVYTPPVTSFLIHAQEAGLKTVDGIGMLLHQAVPGFERWFGIKPKVTKELKLRILASMEKKEA